MSSTAAVPVKTLMITVFESVIEVFLLCLAGYTLSRAGVTDKATQRKLNVINVSLFTPALLFSKVSGNFPITYKLNLKVAYSLTPAKLKEMWVIPLAFVVVSGLSAGVAWGLAKAFGLKKSQTAFAMCASMFQNSNSLPIALIQSLVVEVPHLKWGDDDTKDQMLGRALTYMVLYSTLGMMLRWSLGVKLLSQADEEVEDIDSVIPPHAQLSLDHPVQSPDAMQPHPGAQETDPFFTTARGIAQDELDERSNPGGSLDVVKRNSRAQSPSPSTVWQPSAPGSAHSMHPPEFRRLATGSTRRDGSAPPASRRHSTKSEQGREFWGLPEQPRRQRILLSPEPEEDSSEEEVEDEEWASLTPRSLRRRNVSGPPSSRLRAFGITVKKTAKTALKGVSAFMTVPMYAALLSIFIALIPPLQGAMAKVKPLEQAIRSAGQCSIPVTLVVLGAFFYSPPPSPSAFQAPPAQSYPERSPPLGFLERKFRAIVPSSDSSYPGENKTVFVAVVSRMVIVPLLLLPVVAIIAKFDLFEAAEDPVFILSAVLLISSPPALTLAQITQAASGDAFERLISKTISLSYAVLTPPLTLIYVVIGLVFGRL